MNHSFLWGEPFQEDVLISLEFALANCGVPPNKIQHLFLWAFGNDWKTASLIVLPMRWNFLNEVLDRKAPTIFISDTMDEVAKIIFNSSCEHEPLEIPDYILLDRKKMYPNTLKPPVRQRYEHEKSYKERVARKVKKSLEKLYDKSS